jgi:hypothetical protein
MPLGHCRWPSATADGHPLGWEEGKLSTTSCQISTVRVSDTKSVRVRRCRLGGIWRDFVGPTTQKSICPTSGVRHEACLKMSMNSPTPGIARCARLINKKRVRGKVPGRLGSSALAKRE